MEVLTNKLVVVLQSSRQVFFGELGNSRSAKVVWCVKDVQLNVFLSRNFFCLENVGCQRAVSALVQSRRHV